MTIGRAGAFEAAAGHSTLQPEYSPVTEANIAELGTPIRLRSGRNPDRFIHPVPLKPFAISYEAGRLLLGVVGYAEETLQRPFVTTVDLASLAGIRVTTLPQVGLAMGFYYDKQKTGVEDRERLFRPEGIYFGQHSGHLGDPAAGIGPENPGFYMAGEQFSSDGASQGPRTFPFGRIVGLMGDPGNAAFRAELGLY